MVPHQVIFTVHQYIICDVISFPICIIPRFLYTLYHRKVFWVPFFLRCNLISRTSIRVFIRLRTKEWGSDSAAVPHCALALPFYLDNGMDQK